MFEREEQAMRVVEWTEWPVGPLVHICICTHTYTCGKKGVYLGSLCVAPLSTSLLCLWGFVVVVVKLTYYIFTYVCVCSRNVALLRTYPDYRLQRRSLHGLAAACYRMTTRPLVAPF